MNTIKNTFEQVFSVLILLCVFTAVSPAFAQELAQVLEDKRELYNKLAADIKTPFPDRIAPIPENLLNMMIEYDSSIGLLPAKDYKIRPLTNSDKYLVLEYFELLPPVYRAIAEQKLLRIYFIENFAGGGFTDWVVDPDGNVLYYMILNPSTLTESLGEWLTFREDSIFEPSTHKIFTVTVSGNYRALLYILIHEVSHIVDYELAITPYIDKWHKQLKQRSEEATSFTRDIWAEQRLPMDRFPIFKDGIEPNFYGMYKDKPLIPRSDAPDILQKLRQSPFVSLYGSTIWYEDFADFATWYHLTQKLDTRIVVSLRNGCTHQSFYQPMKSKLVRKRFAVMEQFYREEP